MILPLVSTGSIVKAEKEVVSPEVNEGTDKKPALPGKISLPVNKASGDVSLPLDPLENINPPLIRFQGQISGNPDVSEVYHVISLKNIPKARRKAAKEKIADLLNFIVNQDLDPKLISFFSQI
uniref:Uncharacterized protein n=1 Tax=Graphocephala atropunctata TaxID=36148 RepID=A0A1B6L5E2_9HEMI